MKAASRRARKRGGEVSAVASESLAGIHVLQPFTMEKETAARVGGLSDSTLRAALATVRVEARFGPAVDLCGAFSTAVVLWYGAHRVLGGHLSVGVLLVFLAYLGSLYKPIRALSKLSYLLGRGAASAERIATVLAQRPDVEDRPAARVARRLTGEIHFRDGGEPVPVPPSRRSGTAGRPGGAEGLLRARLHGCAVVLDRQWTGQVGGAGRRAVRPPRLDRGPAAVLA